jgi:hypothetical protein
VTSRVLHASPPPAESAAVSLSAAFFWVFSVLCCVFLLFPPVQSVCVLLKFYWNFCWLDARLALFYLRVSVNVRDAKM